MLDNIPILSLLLFSPLVGILALLFIRSDNGRALRIVGTAGTALPLLLAIWLFSGFDFGGGQQFAEDAVWIHLPLPTEFVPGGVQYYLELGYSLAVDGISLALVFLTALISTMAALASFSHIKKRWKAFYIWFLVMEIGMLGVFMAQDLFLFFIFFEMTLVPLFFLIGIWGYKEREKTANKFLIYNGIGSAFMLLAFIMMIPTGGFEIRETADSADYVYTSNMQTIMHNMVSADSYVNSATYELSPFHLNESTLVLIFFLLLLAFGIKLPIFPFHTWMLKVHTEAAPSVVMLHSGILLKIGAYGLIRFGMQFFPEQIETYALLIAVLGVINILYGAVLALVQSDFKLVLAYSSISHMGIVLLGIASLSEIGVKGAVFQMVSHGFISALMFLLVGSFYERTETTALEKLGGLAQSMPFMSSILLTAGLALLGLPGLSGFISEFLAFVGLFESRPVLTVLGVSGLILASAYVLRSVLRMTYGQLDAKFAEVKDARLIEAIPMIILVAFIVLIGIYPAVLSETIGTAVTDIIKGIGG